MYKRHHAFALPPAQSFTLYIHNVGFGIEGIQSANANDFLPCSPYSSNPISIPYLEDAQVTQTSERGARPWRPVLLQGRRGHGAPSHPQSIQKWGILYMMLATSPGGTQLKKRGYRIWCTTCQAPAQGDLNRGG